MREMWQEFLFTICRQPNGKWANDEDWQSLFSMWIARVVLVLMVCALLLLLLG